MAPFGSAIFFLLVSWFVSVTSDLKIKIISAESGDDVILTCGNENIKQFFILEWIKLNLQGEETVFLYRNDGILLDQDESFRNRVILKEDQMKDGDLSVVLKNLKIEDSGIYQCKVLQENDSQRKKWNLISSISLQVSPPPPHTPPPPLPHTPPPSCPGDEDGEKKIRKKEEERLIFHGVLLGIILTVVVFLAVFIVVLWICKKI